MAENLVLGAEKSAATNWGLLSFRNDGRGLDIARDRLGSFGVVLDDYRRPVRLLSGGQAQSVAIARVVEPWYKNRGPG